MKTPHPRSIPAFCERVGICPATAYNEINRGNLEITKIGARSIITEEQEAAYLDRNRTTGPLSERKSA